MQTYTEASLATYGPVWYAKMQNDGINMWNDPLNGYTNEDLKSMLRLIIDEKYS